jgi:hypothetical protein
MSVTASALTPSYSAPGMLMKENFADLLNTQFKFVKQRDFKTPVQGLQFFTVESTRKDYEKHSYVTGIGLMPKNRDAQKLPFAEPIQGFDNTYTPEDFRLAIRIEKRLRETDQYGVIARQMNALTKSARDTVEYYAADVFNTGFGIGASWLCADGMHLFDSDRPMEDKSQGTWSNLETASALTQASLATMRVNFRKFVDERGLKKPLVMKTLIVPATLEDTAAVIMGSVQKPGVFLNDKNVYENKFEVKVWDFLSSDTAYFGMTAKDSGHELYWYWRVKPETYSNVLADNPDVWQARIRMSFVTGCDRPSTIRGNAGA